MLRNWLSELRKYAVASCAGVLVAAGASRAQDLSVPQAPLPQAPAPQAQPPMDDLKAQLDAQAKEIEELKNMIRAGQIKPVAAEAADPAKPVDEAQVKKILDAYMKEKADKQKKDADDKAKQANDEGYKVGTDLNMGVHWNPLGGVTFETPNKDFTFHVGYRFQLDDVNWSQPAGLKAASPVGVGVLEDGAFFRRNRPSFDGTAWEVMEFNCELALEQVQDSVPNFDECWVGVTQLPFIGSVRAGHIKTPQGLEGDTSSSSKAMTFMERAAYTDAFYENFSTGIWASNNYFDQRMTWEAEVYVQDNPATNSAASFGDGALGYTGRATFLPIYQCEGRELLHLGVSETYRDNAEANPGTGGPGLVRLRARPEMRDAIGDFGTTLAGSTAALPGDTGRMVDTGSYASPATDVVGTELLYIRGPFSVQAEYAWCDTLDSVTILPGHKTATNNGTETTSGGYISLSYFLTGENRTYDKRLGRLGSTYIASPFTPFWAVRGEDGRLSWGPGAWEVAARYSYLSLNSADGSVVGGVANDFTLGLNWYLNTNLKIQFEYLIDRRSELPAGQIPGNVEGFGVRTQVFF